jgi:hypothetical protein
VDELAASSARFGPEDLAAIEAGEAALDDDELRDVLELYAVDPDALLPARGDLLVDLDRLELAAAGRTQALAGVNPTPDEVLGTYLALVYALRALEPGAPLSLRQADVDVLARALALASPDVEQRLERLIAHPEPIVDHQRSRLLRARVLVPAAGVLVAVCVGGALVVRSAGTSSPSSPSTPATSTVTAGPSTDVGSAAVATTSSSIPVVVQNDLPVSDVPHGGVGLAPAQVATRGADGQTDQNDRPSVSVGAGSTSTSTTTP